MNECETVYDSNHIIEPQYTYRLRLHTRVNGRASREALKLYKTSSTPPSIRFPS